MTPEQHIAVLTMPFYPHRRYHALTWPLLGLRPVELLSFLDRDYGLTSTSNDADLAFALVAAGHGNMNANYSREVYAMHNLRRYQAKTDLPF